MNTLTLVETENALRLIELALAEDLGEAGDRTSALIPIDTIGRAAFVARGDGVVAGLPLVPLVMAAIDPSLQFQPLLSDGSRVMPGTELALVKGPIRSLLTAERTSLNFLQRLSGVATLTRRYVDLIAGLPCRLLDTRKTTPGWRYLEKYAVRQGGGQNHRLGLYDGVLIKDNHLAALGSMAVGTAIQRAREHYGHSLTIEVEVDTIEQFEEALAAAPDIILLDNMPPDLLRHCVARRDESAPAILLEASGGVTLSTLRSIAETGVDRVSVGALTHSAVALDIGLDDRP